MPPPQSKNKENQPLPKRWRFRFNAFWYRVPKQYRTYWDGKSEFRLGATLAEAHLTYAKRVQQYESGAEVLTMASLIERYTLEVIPTKSARTQKDEYKKAQTLRQVFGQTRVDAVEPQHIYQVYDRMASRRGLTTANRHMSLLSHMFTYSIRWGARTDHPMTNKRFVKQQPETKRHRYVEDWEIEQALRVAPPIIEGYLRLKLLTGLRQTDLLGLTEADIKDGYLTVEQSKNKKHKLPGLKIVISPDVQDAIDLIRRCKRVGSLHLFSNRRGAPYLQPDNTCSGFHSMWQRWMRKAVKETDLEQSFQERAIRNKVADDSESTKHAQELLGHTSESTTRKYYRQKPDVVTPLKRSKKE